MPVKLPRLVRSWALYLTYHILSNVRCVNEDAQSVSFLQRCAKYNVIYSISKTFFVLDDVQGRPNTHDHNGFTSKRNSRFLRYSCRQLKSFSFPPPVYSRKCELFYEDLISLKNVCVFQIPDYKNSVIVAKHPGSAKKATSYADRLRLGIAVIHGEQKEAESDEVDGRYSPPPVR